MHRIGLSVVLFNGYSVSINYSSINKSYSEDNMEEIKNIEGLSV